MFSPQKEVTVMKPIFSVSKIVKKIFLFQGKTQKYKSILSLSVFFTLLFYCFPQIATSQEGEGFLSRATKPQSTGGHAYGVVGVPETSNPAHALNPDETDVIIVKYNVKKSRYATSDFPRCKQDTPMTEPQFNKYVDAFGSVGAALARSNEPTSTTIGYIIIGGTFAIKGFKDAEGNLGTIGNALREAQSPFPGSECIDKLTVVPKEYTVTRVELSGRNGRGKWAFRNGSTQDWAGWRNCKIGERDGYQIVSATAVNWKHDRKTNQEMRIFVKKK